MTEEKPRRRSGPGGISVSPSKDISRQVRLGYSESEPPPPVPSTIPPEVKKAVRKAEK